MKGIFPVNSSSRAEVSTYMLCPLSEALEGHLGPEDSCSDTKVVGLISTIYLSESDLEQLAPESLACECGLVIISPNEKVVPIASVKWTKLSRKAAYKYSPFNSNASFSVCVFGVSVMYSFFDAASVDYCSSISRCDLLFYSFYFHRYTNRVFFIPRLVWGRLSLVRWMCVLRQMALLVLFFVPSSRFISHSFKVQNFMCL